MNFPSSHESLLDWTIVLKALADEKRLQIIRALLKGDTSVSDLSKTLDIQAYNISKHLKILETGGLVQQKKDGTHRIYFISETFKSRLSENNQLLDLGCCKFMFNGTKK